MIYRHQFQVRTPLAHVAEFHSRSTSMAAITPPPIVVRIHHAPAVLTEGDEMRFTLWLGPLPVHWLARIENVSPNGFTDRQLSGPFATWVHRHTYQKVGEQVTLVIDEITLQIKPHPIWGVVGIGMWLGLPILFAYRAWKTRRILE